MTDNTSQPPEQRFGALITAVGGTVTLFGAVLAVVGITAGTITGLLRNDFPLTIAFLAVALLGVLLGLSSVFIDRGVGAGGMTKRIRWVGGIRGAFAVVGVTLLIVGVCLVVWRGSKVLKTVSRPSIAVTVTPLDKPVDYAALEATVSASGIRTDQRYYIHAELLDVMQRPVNRPVFTSFVGPAADGTLNYTFKVQFPLERSYPWIAITAELDQEREPTYGTSQTCGLPVKHRPPPTGTTCTIAEAPLSSPSAKVISSSPVPTPAPRKTKDP